MIRLGFNIDGFAAMKKACGAPNLVETAQALIKGGVKALFSHAHEGCRYLDDGEIAELKRQVKTPLWLEMPPAAVVKGLKAAAFGVCLVQENSQDIDALDLSKTGVQEEVSKAISILKKKGVKASVLLDCQAGQIRVGKKLGADAVVLSVKSYVNASTRGRREGALEDLNVAARLVRELELELHLGQNIELRQAKALAEISEASLLNLGGSAAAPGILESLPEALSEFRDSLHGEESAEIFGSLKALG